MSLNNHYSKCPKRSYQRWNGSARWGDKMALRGHALAEECMYPLAPVTP